MPKAKAALAAPALATNAAPSIVMAPAPQPNPPGVYVVNLAWDRSPDTTVTGYRIYRGVESGVYTNSFAVGNKTNATVGGLVGGRSYYFAATAYDAVGTESTFSNEVEFEPEVVGTLTIAAWRYANVGHYGKTNQILVSTDGMKSWQVLKTFVGDGTVQSVVATNSTAAYFRTRVKGKQ